MIKMWHMAGHKLHFLPIDGTRWKRVALSLFIQRARTLLTSISRPLNDGPISRLCGDSCIICKTWNTISNKKLHTVARVVVEFLSRRKMIKKKCSPANFSKRSKNKVVWEWKWWGCPAVMPSVSLKSVFRHSGTVVLHLAHALRLIAQL